MSARVVAVVCGCVCGVCVGCVIFARMNEQAVYCFILGGLMTLDWKWCGAVVAINGSTKSVKMYPLERTVALIGKLVLLIVLLISALCFACHCYHLLD